MLTAPLVLLAAACGGPPAREAAEPPPIAATAASPSPEPTQAPPTPTFSTPETERAAAAEQVGTPPRPSAPPVASGPPPTAAPGVPAPATIPDLTKLPPPPTPDPLRVVQDSQARRADYERRLQRQSADLDAARAEVVKRERDLLAFKNPLLARPQLPPDEAQTIQGMDGVARVKWAEDKLTAAKVALETAQKTYDDTKANPPLN